MSGAFELAFSAGILIGVGALFAMASDGVKANAWVKRATFAVALGLWLAGMVCVGRWVTL